MRLKGRKLMSRLIQEASQGRFLEDHLRLSSDVDVISESKVSTEPCMYTSKYKAPSGFFSTTKRGNVERAIPISISGVIKRGFEEDSFTFCRISTTLKIDLKSIPELGSIWIDHRAFNRGSAVLHLDSVVCARWRVASRSGCYFFRF